MRVVISSIEDEVINSLKGLIEDGVKLLSENRQDSCRFTSKDPEINPTTRLKMQDETDQKRVTLPFIPASRAPVSEPIRASLTEGGVRVTGGKFLSYKEIKEALTLMGKRFDKWDCSDESSYCDEMINAIESRLEDE